MEIKSQMKLKEKLMALNNYKVIYLRKALKGKNQRP